LLVSVEFELEKDFGLFRIPDLNDKRVVVRDFKLRDDFGVSFQPGKQKDAQWIFSPRT
jgi:hypothetical protein